MTSDERIKSCSLCHSRNLEMTAVRTDASGNDEIAVSCRSCGWTGEYARDCNAAVAVWNAEPSHWMHIER